MDRRAYLSAAAGLFLAGCTSTGDSNDTSNTSTAQPRKHGAGYTTTDDSEGPTASDTPTTQSTETETTASPTQTPRPPVESFDQLVNRLSAATDGDTITVSPDAEIDLTDQWGIEVPPGVTLEGGRDVENGVPGALLTSPEGDETPEYDPNLRKFVLENGARFTGFRLQGHFTEYVNPATEHDGNYYAHRGGGGVTVSHNAEVDNSEISGWPYAAVVVHGDGHVHDNVIHHNTWEGLGYGVAVRGRAYAPLIESNYFNYNRHSITTPGNSAGYVAKYNVVGPHWVGSQFDVHGTEGMDGIAADRVVIEQNTFEATTTVAAKTRNPNAEISAIQIRGTPTEEAWIRRNWFYHDNKESAVWNPDSYEKIHFKSNHYGENKPSRKSIGAPRTQSLPSRLTVTQ